MSPEGSDEVSTVVGRMGLDADDGRSFGDMG